MCTHIERERERERLRILLLLVHSPNGSNTGMRPGRSQTSIHIFHMDVSGSDILLLFQAPWQGRGSEHKLALQYRMLVLHPLDLYCDTYVCIASIEGLLGRPVSHGNKSFQKCEF